MIQDFKKLRIWKNARTITGDIYDVTSSFPKQELYGLVSQLRRASVSIGANIAEGSAKDSKKEFAYYLQTSSGSAKECQHHLYVAQDARYISEGTSNSIIADLDKLCRMIVSLKKSLNYQNKTNENLTMNLSK